MLVVDERDQVVGIAGAARDQVDEEARVLGLLQVEVDHGVQVSERGLLLERHLLHAIKHVFEDATLVSFLGCDCCLESIDRWALRFQAPDGVQTHKRRRLGLELVDLFIALLSYLAFVLIT